MTGAPLAEFRRGFAGCEIAVLADVSARSVLAWDSAVKWPQEHLDALCTLAAELLSISACGAVREPETAVLADPIGTKVFVRAAPGSHEVLCTVFAPTAVFDGVFDASRTLCAAMLKAAPPRQAVP
ncbi:hypothetical protein ACN2XU_14680 [Primorskyibacter sp. 2E107]|uniref:hypothetical protein n=1 Tax=Primorskyibacter sp. 2E107 TaxID=3403458 RepID=UPI003AF4979F